ncbi:MAG: 1-acyl-sn-glycerol-3-phosphate acyltransferase [Rhodoferax sp.]
MNRIRAVGRLLLVLVHALRGLAIVILLFPRLSQLQRDIRVQASAAALLEHFAIKLIVYGESPVASLVLLVSNHISWLDIVVMHSARHCRFVSKSDIQRWRLIGTLAAAADCSTCGAHRGAT